MSKMSSQDYEEYKDLINQGFSQRKAAIILDIPRTTIQHYLKRVAELENKEIEDQQASKPTLAESFIKVGKSFQKLSENLASYKNTGHGNAFDEFELFDKPKKPLICFYDIETSLAKSYHFQQWKVNLSQKQKIQESHLLSHAWAWNDGEVVGSILTQQEMLDHDPERLVLECWSLLDNCDVLVAHNGKRFDVKKVNSYFLKYGLNPPSPYKVVDTLQIAKNKFALPFNSLAYLAEFLGVEQKIDTGGIDLWIRCDKGDPEALQEMLEYNIGDIITLRGVYNKLIGWDNNAVNMSLYDDEHDMLCPHCTSANISSLEGKYTYTVARKYSLYRCGACGATLRGTRAEGNMNKLVRVV